jgi:hypothetical protein
LSFHFVGNLMDVVAGIEAVRPAQASEACGSSTTSSTLK